MKNNKTKAKLIMSIVGIIIATLLVCYFIIGLCGWIYDDGIDTVPSYLLLFGLPLVICILLLISSIRTTKELVKNKHTQTTDAEPNSISQNQFINCSSCGKEVDKNDKFCKHCGREIK